VLIYHPQWVGVVLFHYVWDKGSFGMGPTKNPARKCGIFLFFHKIEGIHMWFVHWKIVYVHDLKIGELCMVTKVMFFR
jgi:hypothetical protein